MSTFGSHIKSADWKAEKHVPVIEAPKSVKAGEAFTVTVSVGKEIKHPNTTEHFISWIELWFKPEGAGPLVSLGRSEFSTHGEAVAGPNQGPTFTEPSLSTNLQLKVSGTLFALAYCNIHGLWESSQAVSLA